MEKSRIAVPGEARSAVRSFAHTATLRGIQPARQSRKFSPHPQNP